MKKEIIVAILAFIVALIISFAIFSENLRDFILSSGIKGADIKYYCQTGISEELNLNENPGIGYKNDLISCTDGDVILSTKLDDSASFRYFTIKVSNEDNRTFKFDADSLKFNEKCLNDGSEINLEACKTQITLESYYQDGIKYDKDFPNLNSGDTAYLLLKVEWKNKNYGSLNNDWSYNVKFDVPYVKNK